MDELPELPFEQVLSYLNLEDRLKARTVSRAWRNKFDSFRVKTLCFSQRPMNRICGNKRWVSEAFAKNFVNSTCFITFFDTFSQTILSSLKRLRLCDLDLCGNETAFTLILNSFGQLEQLDIIRAKFDQQDEFNLNLPMLISLHLEDVERIKNLILEAPRLRDVKIQSCISCARVEVVHGESVERLLVDWLASIEVKKLKNLQYLYVDYHEGIDSMFLSSLQQLKEFHTNQPRDVSKLFEQKQRSGRADLKIYFKGLLLNGQDDPTMNAFRDSWLVCLAENRSRLADEIPLYRSLRYSEIEVVASSLAVDLLKRFTELKEVKVDRYVQDIKNFLDLLKSLEKIVELTFECDQPQNLFNRLPELSAVQKLSINDGHPDMDFVFRLKHLIYLHVNRYINGKTVRRAFKELSILSYFGFYPTTYYAIETCHPKQFTISRAGEKKTTVSELNAAIEFIFGKRNRERSSPQQPLPFVDFSLNILFEHSL